MNVRDLHDDDLGGHEPPTTDLLAAEYVLGVLDAAQRRDAQARIERDPAFARLVAEWEVRLAPMLAELAPTEVPAHLWPRIRTRLGWSPVERAPGLWQSAGFWRGMTGLAAAAAIAAVVFSSRVTTPVEPVAPTPPPVVVEQTPPPAEADVAKPVTTLAGDDGAPRWLASADAKEGTVLMVPVPAKPDAEGRVPELWLIAPGEPAKSLGIVSNDRSHTVKVPDELREDLAAGAVLAITLEPPGGAPQGVATGPIVAKGEMII